MAQENPSRYDKNLYENHLMGYTMRTERYRLVLWVDYRDPQSEPYGVELYDLKTDPDENTNLAKLPKHAGFVDKLATRLLEHVMKGKT